LETLSLKAHPRTPARRVDAVEATLAREGDAWTIGFLVHGAEHLLLPPPAAPARTDGLWEHLCFELFVRPEGERGYFELNFSPSSRWAAYSFERYREGMADLPLRIEPLIRGVLGAKLTLPEIGACVVGLCAVIEERDGTKSYWALAHPPSGPPDFHHPDCFALTLPAPGAA
jgi:hypothetical protein